MKESDVAQQAVRIFWPSTLRWAAFANDRYIMSDLSSIVGNQRSYINVLREQNFHTEQLSCTDFVTVRD